MGEVKWTKEQLQAIQEKNSNILVAAAAQLIKRGEYGYMVAIKNNDVTKVPLEEVAGRLKTVDPNCTMIQDAKGMGICFGDE